MYRTAIIRPDWTPATIALMVLGFVVFWPLGLAMLGYILFGERLHAFKREANERLDGFPGFCRSKRWAQGVHPRSTGNVAFDEWRRAELNRLEEERRKLDEMRAEFDTYMYDLRKAKDQEEFDRFMRQRKQAGEGPVTDPQNGFSG